ncbi:CBS domain-containing protein [Desulfolithobacter sp.]
MKARDIMVTIRDYLDPDTTLREAVLRMRSSKRHHGLAVKGMLVRDRQNNKVVGMLSIKDIMRAVIPPYLTVDLSVFSWDNMLEDMTRRAREKTVADVMTKEVISVADDAPLMVCVDIMIRKGLQRLPVKNKDGEIVGMVYIRDVYNLIADILVKEEK